MPTIAMLHTGLQGHLGPANRLAAELSRQGHRLLAWGPESARATIEATGAALHPHEPVARHELYGGFAGFAALLARATERCTAELVEQLFEADVDLVVHDCHAPWGRVAADFLGIARVVSDPLFPTAVAMRLPVDPGFASASAGAATYPGGLDAALAEVDACRRRIGQRWGVDIGSWRAVVRSDGDCIACYTTPAILGATPPRPGWHCIGPLMERLPDPTISSAAGSTGTRPLIYVAFGTFYNYDRRLFQAVIRALADAPVDVIVSTGRGYVSPADLAPVPDNVVVHDYVDSREVLARASVHVTHGGCSSVHESLTAGVPMVLLPQGADHFAWSYRVEQLGAGRRAVPDSESIGAAVHDLLTDPSWRERAGEIAGHLHTYDGSVRVAGLLDASITGRTRIGASGAGQEVGGRGVSSDSARGRSSRPSATGTS